VNKVFICLKCKRMIDPSTSEMRRIRCPFCGYKILAKARPKVIKSVLSL